MKYRTKAAYVDAFQWTGGPDQTDDPVWICEAIRDGRVQILHPGSPAVRMRIYTCDKIYLASLDDWIIREDDGTIRSCDPETFSSLYEECDS